MPEFWWLLSLVGIALALLVALGYGLGTLVKESRLGRARRGFHSQRERLEAKFVQLATLRAKADAPNWADCDFDDDVAFVRNRATGELAAFVAVIVSTDGPPPNLDDDELGSYRSGTAVFRFDGDHWETDGRALLNLSPAEAIRFYRDDLEMVAQE